MGWSKAIRIENGHFSGDLITVGNFTGILPFINYTDNYNWFPLVEGNSGTYNFEQYGGLEIENFDTFVVEELGNGSHLLACIRTDTRDSSHPYSGTFIAITLTVANISYDAQHHRVSADLGVVVDKRVYDIHGNITTTQPLGNYFPASTRYLTGSTEEKTQFPYLFYVRAKIICGELIHDGVKHLAVGFVFGHPNGKATCYSYNACRMKVSFFQSGSGWGADAELPEGDVLSPEFGEAATEKGGYNEDATHGSFDDTSDTITLSSKPTLSVGDSGFVHAYVVTKQILQQIGTALFPTIDSSDPSLTGIPEAINYLTMVMFFNKRTDYILDVLILPITVPSGSVTRVRVGGSDLVVTEGGEQVYCQAPPVSEYYVDVDCGSLSIPEYWANFLDFTGSRFKLFLPAVGYVDLQGEFINGGTINVKYRFNIVDGSFMCYVTSTSGHSNLKNSLVAQYSGVWAMHIPITGQDYTNKISGLISSVGSVAMGGMMGGGGALMGAVSSLANTAMQKPQTTHANGYNASSSFLTHRKPYLIIERQSSQFSEQYPSESGLPCYVSRKLSAVHGFTVIENPVLNIACSDAEYNELVQLLKSGVIL